MIGLMIKDPVHFMASDAHFRDRRKQFFMKLLGAFPKAKAMNDMSAIRYMMGFKKKKKVICIYPEGQMTWDGRIKPNPGPDRGKLPSSPTASALQTTIAMKKSFSWTKLQVYMF